MPFVEDASNADVSFTRNAIRHKLIPFIEQHFESRTVLAERAWAVSEDMRYLQLQATKYAGELLVHGLGSKDWLRACRQVLSVHDPVFAWRIVDELLKTKLGFNLGRFHSLRVLEFLLGEVLAIEIPGELDCSEKMAESSLLIEFICCQVNLNSEGKVFKLIWFCAICARDK